MKPSTPAPPPAPAPTFDDVLKRMLSTPPQPRKAQPKPPAEKPKK